MVYLRLVGILMHAIGVRQRQSYMKTPHGSTLFNILLERPQETRKTDQLHQSAIMFGPKVV